MAGKRGGRDFLPGNPGGPGRPRILPEVKGLPTLNHDTFRRLLLSKLSKTKEELLTEIKSKETKALDLWLCNIAMKGIEDRDVYSLEPLLNRLIGRVEAKLEISNTFEARLESMPKEELIARAEEGLKLLKSSNVTTIDVEAAIPENTQHE